MWYCRHMLGVYCFTHFLIMLVYTALYPNEYRQLRLFLNDSTFEFLLFSICRPFSVVYLFELFSVLVTDEDDHHETSEVYTPHFVSFSVSMCVCAGILFYE